MKMPLNIGVVHFIGIGGIGMSGIAEALHLLGYSVQGSDQAESANIERLRAKGIKIFVGHAASNLDDVEVVVVSTAINRDNIELVTARSRRIPVVRRAEMLAELMRFRQSIAIGGTHGKTTTTSLIASLLHAGKLDPTVINGGIINSYGTNAYIGQGNWMVVEADESDGSFLKLPSDIVVVTNMDPEHLDYYNNFENMQAAYRQFIENIPFYGLAVLCADHAELLKLAEQIEDRRVITYGASPAANITYANYHVKDGHAVFDVIIKSRKKASVIEITNLELPVPGIHNVANATAAVGVAYSLGVDAESIRAGLLSFKGVKRRFTHIEKVANIDIYDDYAHHPNEIMAVISAAKDICKGRVIAVSQPHRYSRLANLMDEFAMCFNAADQVIITPVYAAGELAIDGVDGKVLADKIRKNSNIPVHHVEDLDELTTVLVPQLLPGDILLFLGAGSITKWAHDFPAKLAEQLSSQGI